MRVFLLCLVVCSALASAFPNDAPAVRTEPTKTVSGNPINEVVPANTLEPQVETSSAPKNGGKMVVCYFTNWAWYRNSKGKYLPSDIDPTLCTHIVYGFAVLDSNKLTIKAYDQWADIDNKFYQKVTALKSNGTKVTVSIGGWNDSEGGKYSRLVNSAASRKKFVENVVTFIKKYNFDGLDLDWEYPKCWQVDCDAGPASDKENFGKFVQELRAAFGTDLLLSAAVSPNNRVIDAGYDVPVLSENLDWIAVMNYDYHGDWDSKTGHIAPMYHFPGDDNPHFNVNYSINYWIEKGASRNKLVLGMPLYGQSFTLTNPNNHGLNAPSTGAGGTAGKYSDERGTLAYYEICKSGWTVVQDQHQPKRMGPYAYKGNQWVSYDDVDTIAQKSHYVVDQGLAGAMIWALDLDDFRGMCGEGKYPLLRKINEVLKP